MKLMDKNSSVSRIYESISVQNHSHTNQSRTDADSRRSSGNSIKIRVINDSNILVDDESFDCILNENYSILNETERRQLDEDDHEVENSTSNSNSNEQLERTCSKKKLKERKQLCRSAAQQQHHLVYQESEDQPEAAEKSSFNSVEALGEPVEYQSQNSAFDELFAAAKTGNFIKSAHVEAKMAIAAHKDDEPAEPAEDVEEQFFAKKNLFNGKVRNGSFKNRQSFKKVSPYESNPASSPMTALKVQDSLGSPQPLTRSCSCKRPGSFKKMRAKAEVPAQVTQTSRPSVTTPSSLANNGRRSTQCSIMLSEEMDKENVAASADFEQDAEVCRVRQFNMTNKGSVINRGDSFKRSFKRSSNSISSKKDASPVFPSHDGSNTLNLPDFQDAYLNKSVNSSSCGLNDDTASGVSAAVNSTENHIPLVNATEQTNDVKTYLVYMIGSSSVGKNALIKQFKTSEYRGTYDINTNQGNDDLNEGVTIMLDGVESILQFVSMDIDMIKLSTFSLFEITKDNDAFIVVYSISDKASFTIAIDLLRSIRLSENKNQPVILVGNKSDLVRKRSISREDAKIVALKFSCKFVETSVAINDKVDDLLAGILKQIRLNELAKQNTIDITTTSFIENSKKQVRHYLETTGRKHSRNLSDVHVEELLNTNNSVANRSRTNANFMSLKSNTLTRKLFRNNKDKDGFLESENNRKLAKISFTDQQSFFHKLFNNIFKKKSNISHLQSVENLYTAPRKN